MKKALSVTPLGGLGEIGMNMMVFEYGNDAILIDCGVLFPDSIHYGIDIIIPDFSYLLKIKHKIRGLLLTHGHEDHIGAIPYLLKHLNVPIYGSRFTLALVESRLREYDFIHKPRLHRVRSGQKVKLGVFGVEFIPIAHSIVDSAGLAIKTPEGTVIHTGDFKLDPDPYHGKKTSLKKFEEYGKKGVLLLLSDSTNVERTGKSLSENQIKTEISKIISKTKGRVIFSVFASNIRRIEQVLEIASTLNRKVALSGRSVENNMEIARKLGFISAKLSKTLIDLDRVAQMRPEKVIVICTGSQAEFGSSLWRMAMNEHRQIRIKRGDTVILSSRFIPGNEKDISRLIDDLYRLGAEVLYGTVAPVHVSGHAHSGELKKMMQAVNPRYFIPVHGELRHLIRHGQLAQGMKIPKNRVFVCENGDRVTFHKGQASRGEGVDANYVFVDGKNTREIDTSVLKDRRQLSETGIIFAVLIRNKKQGTIVTGPDLYSKGVIDEEHQALMHRAQSYLQKVFKKSRQRSFDLQEELRLQTRRFFKREVGKKPVVFPLVIDL